MTQAFVKCVMLLVTGLMLPHGAMACQGLQYEDHVTRIRPVSNVPFGVVQLEVDVPYDEDKLRSKKSGTVTMPVKRVLHGTFKDKMIKLEFNNMNSCEYFGPTGPNRYIVVYPVLYDEGDPVKNKDGSDFISIIRYNNSIDPEYTGVLDMRKAQPDDIMRERKILSCLRRGGGTHLNSATGDISKKCFKAKNPDKVFSPIKWWVYGLSAMCVICIALGAFVLWKKYVA